MTETFYRARSFQADHTTFGGIIRPSDYNTDCGGKRNTDGSVIARRILSDQRFDEQCRKNAENRTRRQ